MTHLAMGYLTLGDLDPFAMVAAAGAGGFRAAGVRLTGHRPGDAWPFDPADPAHVARMRGVMRASGVTLVNACSYRVVADTDPADYAALFAACAGLGIGMMIANCFCPEPHLARRHLHAMAGLAAAHGLRIAVEFIPVSAVKTLADAARIVDGAPPNLGIAVDALHLWRSGGGPTDLAAVDQGRLFLVQLCDGPRAAPQGEALYAEMRGGRLLPGEGAFDLTALLDALPKGIEVEAEVPNTAFAALPPTDRARRVRLGTEAFLTAWESRT